MIQGETRTITLTRAEVQRAIVGAAVALAYQGDEGAKFDCGLTVNDDGSVNVKLTRTDAAAAPAIVVPYVAMSA